MEDKKMKILIFGGTGAIGVYLVNLLFEQGHELFITTRNKRVNKDRITYIQLNAHDNVLVQEILLKKWDVIVDFMLYSTVEFAKRIDLLLSSTNQYVFLSSARIFADTDTLITEKSARLLDVSTDVKYLKTDEYALSKARQEDLLYASKYKNWTIVRPYITFSKTRLQLGAYEKNNWLYRALHGRAILFSKDIASHYTTLTYGLDVARAITGLIGNLKAIEQDFNIVTNEAHTWQEVLELYLDVLESKLNHRIVVKYLDSAVDLQFEKTRYKVEYCRLFNRRFDNFKILSIVPDLQFSNTMQELSQCLEIFLNNQEFIISGWGMEAILDKLTGDRTSINEILNTKQYIKYFLLRHSPLWLIKSCFK